MPIKKRVQRSIEKVIFRLHVAGQEKPTAQFTYSVPYSDGMVIIGGKEYLAKPTGIDSIPYGVSKSREDWNGFNAAQFKEALQGTIRWK